MEKVEKEGNGKKKDSQCIMFRYKCHRMNVVVT